MRSMQVFGSGLSPYVQRVMLAAQHKGIELTLVAPEGGSRSEAHLARNPMGKVPVLIDGDLVLPESDVIVAYLEDAVETPSLFNGDASARAHVRLLVRVLDTYGPKSFRAFVNRDQAGIDEALARTRESLGYLERLWQATGGAHATGAAFSAADCALVPFFSIFETLQAGYQTMDIVAEHPQVHAWWKQARASAPGELSASTLQAAIEKLLAG